MNYIYFELDKNSKQFKTLTIGEYTIDLRIEWNVRSKSWFILGYIGEDLVLTNTKFEANRLYSFDKNISQNLPYNISVLPKFPDNDWDTPTAVVITDDFYANSKFGLSEKNIFIDRNIATSAFTHSKTSSGSTRNSYLFELEDNGGDKEIIIICDTAGFMMQTIGLPTGQWDFKINNTDYRLAIQDGNYSEMITLFSGYGVVIKLNENNGYYDWINESDESVKIYGLYPLESGYKFIIDKESNNSATVINTDENDWVNEFSVCLTSFSVTNPDLNLVVSTLVGRYINNPINYTGKESADVIYESIGWSIDDSGKVTKKPESDIATPNDQYYYYNGNDGVKYSNPNSACQAFSNIYPYAPTLVSDNRCNLLRSNGDVFTWFDIWKASNPAYNPSAPPLENIEVTQEEITNGLRNAIESNDAELTFTIDKAIHDAYSYDSVAGHNELYNSLNN